MTERTDYSRKPYGTKARPIVPDREHERLSMSVKLRADLIEKLIKEAQIRKVQPGTLLREMIEHVLEDGLIAAVMDDA